MPNLSAIDLKKAAGVFSFRREILPAKFKILKGAGRFPVRSKTGFYCEEGQGLSPAAERASPHSGPA